MYFILSFIILNLLIYYLILLWIIIGITKSSGFKNEDKKNNYFNVSIIVCVKNEESHLINIINDLISQIYNENMEFIIVDDSVDSKFKEIINHYNNIDSRVKYVSSQFGDKILSYKKKALDAGIKHAMYDYLLFTDVSCRLSKEWVSTMMHEYNYNADYVIGLSIVPNGKKIVSKFQKIDFMMLMLTTIGTTKSGFPLASTGQNQSYKKDLFLSVGGFNKIANLIQGDDTIFLQICNTDQPININICTNNNSFVQSKLHSNWVPFLRQRIRWAGDGNMMWRYNKFLYSILVITFTTNLIYIIAPFILYHSPLFLILIFLIKFIFEFLLYFLGSKKINQNIEYLNFIVWFFIQIPYVVLMGFSSFIANRIGWKTEYKLT